MAWVPVRPRTGRVSDTSHHLYRRFLLIWKALAQCLIARPQNRRKLPTLPTGGDSGCY